MAENNDRTLRNILEKLELLTGERSDGSRRAVLISELNGLTQNLTDENAAIKKMVRELSVQFNQSSASFKEEITVRADENSALSQMITTLRAAVGKNVAEIQETKRALATKTMAMAEQIISLSATVGNNSAKILEEKRVRTTATDSLAQTIQTLTATVNSNNNTLTASIQNEQTARANGDSANASSISTLTSTVNGHTSSLTTLSSTTATINGNLSLQWGIRGSLGGKQGGLVLNGVKKSDDSGAIYNLEIGANTLVYGVLTAYDSSNNVVFSTYPNTNLATYIVRPLIDSATINSSSSFSVYSQSGMNNGTCIYGIANGSYSNGVCGQSSWVGVLGNGGTYDFYANGAGTNYGPFTGAHDALTLPSAVIDVGDILVDVECLVRRNISNTLCRVEKSTSPVQKGAIGVLSKTVGLLADGAAPAAFDQMHQPYPEPEPGYVPDYSVPPPAADNEMTPIWNAMKDNYNHVLVNALGEGQINVCGENGDIEIGDLIVTSSIPGKGMRQSDDIIRSTTVAKVRENVTFSSPTEVKMVACIYLCG